jgi:small subunit ribosomal protein S5
MPKLKKKLTEGDGKEQELLQEVEEIEEKEIKKEIKELEKKKIDIETWQPKTSIGKDVKAGNITDIDEILDNGLKILESEIVDVLLPGISVELLLVGQSKGKFGGGQRRIFRQTQKKTKEGNKPRFATFAVAGNENGYIGIGYGKSKETVPAREKAIRNAKLNIMKIKRGCGSWQCGCGLAHSIPFTIQGKCGSVKIKFMPAPKGTGLRAEHECTKILKLAGIRDVWSKTSGKTATKFNLIKACIAALKQLVDMKIKEEDAQKLGVVEGRLKKEEKVSEEEILPENEEKKKEKTKEK